MLRGAGICGGEPGCGGRPGGPAGGLTTTTTGGGLAGTPKAVEIGVDNVLSGNVYAPNGTVWLKDRARATGSLFGKDVQMDVDSQVSLSSAW